MKSFSAALLEIQRFSNINAGNIPHRTVRDTSVGSIPIPADTMVIGNLHSVMTNKVVYKDSEKFIPERFLMDDGITPSKGILYFLLCVEVATLHTLFLYINFVTHRPIC